MTKLRKEFYRVKRNGHECVLTVPASLVKEFKPNEKSKVTWRARNGKLFATINK